MCTSPSRTMSAVSDMQQVHEWFLHRGLPLVLTRRVRSRDLIERSAPMVSGVGALTAVTMLLAEVTGANPDYGYALRLGVIAVVLLAAPFALYLLHRSGTHAGRGGQAAAAPVVMAIFVVGHAVAGQRMVGRRGRGGAGLRRHHAAGHLVDLPRFRLDRVVGVPVRLGAVRCPRHPHEPRAAAADADPGRLLHRRAVAAGGPDDAAKALAGHRIPGPRRLCSSWSPRSATRCVRCARTAPSRPTRQSCWRGRRWPATPSHQPARTPLSRAEQINVVAVMVVSQAIQVVLFTAGLFAFFLALGIIAIPDDVTVLWSARADLFGGRTALCGNMVRRPHPDTADRRAHVAVRCGAVRAVLHREHQRRPAVPQRFFDPLIVRRGGEPGRPRRLPRIEVRSTVPTRRPRPTGTGPGSTRCRWPATRSTTCR